MAELPSTQIREAISEAVHHAVVEVTGSDGSECCLFYALAGCVLSRKILQRNYIVQAGSIAMKLDHQNESGEDGWLSWNARENALFLGSFHAWYVCPHSHNVEIVDLSSRHYQTIADRYHYEHERPLQNVLEQANPLWSWADEITEQDYIMFKSTQELVN